jgi:hypothetical protein
MAKRKRQQDARSGGGILNLNAMSWKNDFLPKDFFK